MPPSFGPPDRDRRRPWSDLHARRHEPLEVGVEVVGDEAQVRRPGVVRPACSRLAARLEVLEELEVEAVALQVHDAHAGARYADDLLDVAARLDHPVREQAHAEVVAVEGERAVSVLGGDLEVEEAGDHVDWVLALDPGNGSHGAAGELGNVQGKRREPYPLALETVEVDEPLDDVHVVSEQDPVRRP